MHDLLSPSKKKMKIFIRGLVTIFGLFLITLVWFFITINLKNSNDHTTQLFVIQQGEGSTKIAQRLKDEKLVKSMVAFELYVWNRGISSKLQDGEYYLPRNLTITQVAQILNRGASSIVEEKTLTFIEGWNNNQYADYLVARGMIDTPEDFFAVIQRKAEWWDEYAILKSRPKTADLEGYLFPDTYRVYTTASVRDIVEKMLFNVSLKFDENLQAEVARQGKTIHEILTLASILEKEVISDHDRAMVADIFYKRLDIGMALQADSTVNYVTGRSDSRARGSDLNVDSLYNTYKYAGLPPGPIANPSLSAIKAAIYPQKNDYWYFLTTPSGEVVYSKTYEQHVTAKNKYY